MTESSRRGELEAVKAWVQLVLKNSALYLPKNVPLGNLYR